ncbi:MAG: RfaE bifunctional protein, partial [uncultured bacterium]
MKIDIKNLKKIINKFKGKKVLVIGDIMLDHFIWGKVKRISPEAPVPVVEVVSESYMPGGAANVAMNLNALGISTDIIGVFGNDSNGELLQKQLKKSKVNTKGMVKSSSASTTKKSRIIAHNQQVVRVDRDSKNLTSDDEDLIIARVKKMVPLFDGVIVEDYGKGVISQHVFDEIIKVAKQNNIFTSFDPKMGHDILCAGIDLCTPNLEEARYLNKISSPNMPLDLPKQGEQLRENLGINNLL